MPEAKRVAVMQPYFYPYAGYYRLMALADEFIIYDCVQFPSRGRVHRCRVPGPSGSEEWLTLPLQKQRRSTRIHQLRFAGQARSEFDRRLDRLPWIAGANGPQAEILRAQLYGPMEDVTDFLEDGLRLVRDMLGFKARLRRSSTLELKAELRGQDRILAICAAVGAQCYLNAPGGRDLYSQAAFGARGIELEFLPEYRGKYAYMLPALLQTPASELRGDILEHCGQLLG